MRTRYVTDERTKSYSREPVESTPFALEWEEIDGREDPEQRFALYRLCECAECGGMGKRMIQTSREPIPSGHRCPACRGEGRTLQLLATCESPEAAGVALVTLAREEEWADCPLGLLDRQGETGKKWLIRPWLPSARNISDAGRVLGSARKTR